MRTAIAVALALAAITAGCGGGPVVGEAAKAGAKALTRLNQGIKQPANRVARTAVSVDAVTVENVLTDAFCEGFRMYVQENRFPTGQEWGAIAVARLEALGVPYHAAVSQAISLYESLAYGLRTGDFDLAEVELYCL